MTAFKDHITAEIEGLVEPILAENDLELVEVQFRQEQIGWVLRIIIYKDGGVSIDDCTLVSRQVSHILDVEDLIPQKYNLEVSSPGLDRPLSTERDFLRNKGEKIKLTIEDGGGSHSIKGVFQDVQDGTLLLKSNGDIQSYPLGEIKKARLVIEF